MEKYFFFVMKDAYVKRNIKEYKERGRERQKDGKRQQDIYILKCVSTKKIFLEMALSLVRGPFG